MYYNTTGAYAYPPSIFIRTKRKYIQQNLYLLQEKHVPKYKMTTLRSLKIVTTEHNSTRKILYPISLPSRSHLRHPSETAYEARDGMPLNSGLHQEDFRDVPNDKWDGT